MAIEEIEPESITFSNVGPSHINRMIVISIQWSAVPWRKRWLAVAALPYQFLRFLFTGNADILQVKNVSKRWP